MKEFPTVLHSGCGRKHKLLFRLVILLMAVALTLLLPSCTPREETPPEEPSSLEVSREEPQPPDPVPGPDDRPAQYYPTDKLFITNDRMDYEGGMVLSVPGMGFEGPVLPDVEEETLALGVGLYPYSPMPDGPGANANVSVAGHRDLYGYEFYDIDKLSDGDLLYIYYEGKTYTYSYEYTEVIQPDDWSVIHCTDYPCLTLTSCHPIGVADHRIIVRARLTGVEETE